MSVFTRKDVRWLAIRDPSWAGALVAMLRRHACAAGILLLLAVCAYVANVALGLHAAAPVDGEMTGLAVDRDVTIARDARGIPHIRARTLHDLFFAEGFAQASDRLFEMEITRRYAYGRLAEVFGAKALPVDEEMRAADISAIAAREWKHTGGQARRALQAFSDGVNAAEQHTPLPVEFRMLLYRPKPWMPQDSIAVSLVAALELGDAWRDVIARDERWRALSRQCFAFEFPLSDPRYDVSIDGRLLRDGPALRDPASCDSSVAIRQTPRLGSNAWAAGSLRTADHRALIANDPHVDLTIPGIWYAIEMQAPGFHAAGAVIPGLPGLVLGHNEHIAWGVTNAQVATSAIYRLPAPPARSRVLETFGVRFGIPVTKAYYRTRDAFSINVNDEGGAVYMVRWPPYRQSGSTLPALLALDRARTIASAMHSLSAYHGAPQNFIVAGTSGAVAYHMAGAIYDDPAWGRYVHPARDLQQQLPIIPFGRLPSHGPTRAGILLSANNRMYGRRYPYRLSAAFEPPYRAYRIAQLLHARRTYDAAYFERMQMDTCSPVDAEIAGEITRITRDERLAGWDGCFTPSSKRATVEYQVRSELLEQTSSFAALLGMLRHPDLHARNGIDENASAALQWLRSEHRSWARAGRVNVEHPLSSSWYGLLSAGPLPGDGNDYTIHLQQPGFAQGFRAVWEVGNWDAGGIVLPTGESGEPGSGHYDDLAKTWVRGTIVPLPFTRSAVRKATVSVLILRRTHQHQ